MEQENAGQGERDALPRLPPGLRQDIDRAKQGGAISRRRACETLCQLYREHEAEIREEMGFPDSEPDPIVSGFRILEPLGQGSLGEVYLAERQDLDEGSAHLHRFRIGQDLGRLLILREGKPGHLDLLDDAVLAADLGLEDRPGLAKYVLDELHARPITEFCDQERLSVDARMNLFLQACDGVQSAHQRGLSHHDIKAGNVVVDDRSEPPRVRVLHLGLRGGETAEGDPQLAQLGGRYLGSPRSMSPEQAGRGERSPDLRSDVYSLGSLLYELLVGFPPHFPDLLAGLPIEEMQRRIRDQIAPLASLSIRAHSHRRPIASLRGLSPSSLRRRLRGDLDAILGRALARDRKNRYGSVQALADDLRRHRAHLPIEARNENILQTMLRISIRHARMLAAIGIATTAFGLGYWSAPRQSATDPIKSPPLANSDPGKPEPDAGLRGELERSTQRILQLEASDLVATAEAAAAPNPELPLPEQRRALIAWLEQFAAPLTTSAAQIEFALTTPTGSDPESRTHAEGLREALAIIRSCQQRNLAGPEQRLRWVEDRLNWLAVEDQRCLDDFDNRWHSRIRAIAKDPIYEGLELLPQHGLIPLGRDPASGLFEFYHPGSAGGDRSLPVPDETGALRIDGDSGMVFVLIPATTMTLGAQGGDPRGVNYDPNYQDSPAHVPAIETTLPAFFLSKYELTQGQWSRLAGENGSFYAADLRLPSGELIGLDHPAEQISWQAAMRVLGWTGLRLPTEAEWEYAGRAGKQGRVLADAQQVEGLANLADQSIARMKPWAWDIHRSLNRYPHLRSRWPTLDFMDDGYVLHAPVGSFRANDFGLHDMHGNVAEWCLGWIEAGAEDQQIARGDHFLSRRPSPIWRRDTLGQGTAGGQPHIGVRAARGIDR